MKKFYLLILCFLLSLAGYAQTTISARVIDEKQKPMDYATVLLHQSADSVLVKTALTDANGKFSFPGIKAGQYSITISVLGYKKASFQVKAQASALNLPDIQLTLDATMLKEATVVARKSFLEQRGDKLVVNVSGSPIAAGATVFEVLQKVPGVIVSNDQITLVGKGAPIILIDGRASQYTDVSQVLKDMSSANIDRIEVIANPGAKYDAAGGSVINIILMRNANLGTNGNISLASGMSPYSRKTNSMLDRNFYRLSPGISLNHRAGKLNVYGGYNYLKRSYYDYSEFSRIIDVHNFVQQNYTPGEAESHNFRLGADLYADKKNTFGAIIRGFVRDGSESASNDTEQLLANNGQLVSSFNTSNNTQSNRNNVTGNLNWKHRFDSLGTDLNVDLDYSKFNINNSSLITNRLTNGSSYNNSQIIDNPIQFGVLKVDYSHPFNKNTTLEAGAKSSVATINNYLTYQRNGVTDNNRSTDFLYTENINAAYASIEHKMDKWDFKAGLRGEQTLATGKEKGQQVLNRNYWQLFPSLFITREVNSKLSTVLQYSRRVNRPSFQQQNPFIQYLDSLTYTRGNPLLRPETADQYKVSLNYQNQPFFSLSYNQKHDVIFDHAPRQEGNLTYTTSENLASFENFAAELNFPIQFGKKISGYGGNQFIYNHYKADYLGGRFDRGKWNWLAYWQVSYKPADTWNMEVSGYYMTRFLNEFLILNQRGGLNLAIQKSFMDKRARISLNAYDLLHSDQTNASIIYQEINTVFHQHFDSRNMRLTFSYSFGNQKLKAARNRSTGSEDEANRVKN